MAVDQFMKFEGIEGESKDSKHKNEVDVLAWSWGASQSGSFHTAGGGGSGKVSVQDLSFTKYVDKSSTNLFLKCCDGKHIPSAVLTVRKAGESPVEYLKITMEPVLVTSVSGGGSGGEDRITENITLNFAKVKIEYTEQKEDGSAGATDEKIWNIMENIQG
jgi:type VI secretion system secreted protein Hcp